MVERLGIYFGLPEEDYHKDRALGSSSMKSLSLDPAEWWFQSDYNPMQAAKKKKKEFEIGSAYHALILEGTAALEKRYGPKLLDWTTIEGKKEKARFADVGKIAIPVDDWQRILVAGKLIEANGHLKNAFSAGISEVSIFWNDGDVRKKARIDHLKIRANSDLKTTSPQDGVSFRRSCRKAMGRYRYYIQAAHYNEGRGRIAGFLKKDLVHGECDMDLLRKIAASTAWASTFTFVKKTGAPLTYACAISMGSMLLERGHQKCTQATETFLAYRDKFGMDSPWIVDAELEEMAIEEIFNEDLE